MSVPKMHDSEVHTDELLVRRLLASQFPQWADLPIALITSAGTSNVIFRLGEEMSVRLPRLAWAQDQIDKEYEWMPRLAPSLPLKIPAPVAQGQPSEEYPFRWSVYHWLEGENVALEQIIHPCQAAADLAHFLTALQAIDTSGGPPAEEHNARGLSLSVRDEETREAIVAMRGMIDSDTATAAWESALGVPEWDRDPVWFHGDMLPGNLLFKQGWLHAVIDFAGLSVGDPACDLMIAWGLFAGESREVFRETLGLDEATWLRGRGQALAQALVFIPYYLDTNPSGVAVAKHTVDEILADFLVNG